MLRRVSVGVAVAALLSFPAQAQTQQTPPNQSPSLCGNRAEIVKRLGDKYKERPYQVGVTSEGKLLEVFAAASGTWTMLMTRPNGESCLVIHGEGWKPLTTARAATLKKPDGASEQD